ncbi:hypothetical protein SS50377_20228 [Spironucleus salmonicida]|uniref:Uncharacterized protein n=1 Tax=Spironucleus salmonicida TaxID=348837 RepID=V6LWV4_9EUKA|nr:hypothetical protein SS50377_20228 [Spironucleus salmonicida]|eukprot:EST45284.1 Hypothetical protein SS50377_14860 [Spironucleus salmonicida]
MSEQSAENHQFECSPQQSQKGFRTTRRSAQLNMTTPIVLNTQRLLQEQFLKTAELDPYNPLHHPQDLALQGNDVSRNLTANTQPLLTEDDGTSEAQALRELEQIYINELRKELEQNRSQNFTYEQKQKIFEAAQKRFERLVVQNSQMAAMMTSDVPETIFKFQQRYSDKQERFEQGYAQIIDKHEFLSKQMDEMLRQAYELTRKDEIEREEYIQSNFQKWTEQAIVAGEKVSIKYQQIDQRVQQIELQIQQYANERKNMTQKQLDETLTKKEVIENEYQQALYDRQQIKEQLEEKVFKGRDEQFDQYIKIKQEENEKKVQIKEKCEQLKIQETTFKLLNYEQKLGKSQQQLAKIQEEKTEMKQKQAQLLKARTERAKLSLQQQEEQRDEMRKQRDLQEDQRMRQKQLDDEQQKKRKSLQADVSHYKEQVVTKAQLTGAFEIPEKIVTKSTPSSILAMPREQAMQIIVNFEDQNRKQFLPENIPKTPNSQAGTPSMRLRKLPTGSLTPKLPDVRSSSRPREVSSNSLKRISDASNIYAKTEAKFAVKENEVMMKRQYNEQVVELVQAERTREEERNQFLIQENDDEKRKELETVFQSERDEFEQKLKTMEQYYQSQVQ